jgi:hypothetical protein
MRNTALGYNALVIATVANQNVAIGERAMAYTTTGSYNVAVGQRALRNNTVGRANVAVGRYAGFNNTSAGFNTNIGYSANYKNCTGTNNVSVGAFSLECNTASNNTAVGFCALRSNTAGYGMTAVGYRAAQLSTCRFITAIGHGALCLATAACHNTVVGAIAGRNVTTGIANVAVGYYALGKITTGSGNIVLGHYAQASITGGINNTIAVGYCACTSATTGHTVWGSSANNVCNCVYAAWSTVSDCRDKTNIQTLPSKLGLDLIKKLRPVAFNWDHRDTYVRECSYEYGEKDGTLASTKEHYGLIAQELKQTLDELNVKFDGLGHDTEKDAYRVTYEELIPSMIKAIQEQQVEIESLKDTLQRNNIS